MIDVLFATRSGDLIRTSDRAGGAAPPNSPIPDQWPAPSATFDRMHGTIFFVSWPSMWRTPNMVPLRFSVVSIMIVVNHGAFYD